MIAKLLTITARPNERPAQNGTRPSTQPSIAAKAARLKALHPDHAAIVEQTIDALLDTQFSDEYIGKDRLLLYSAAQARRLAGEVLAERLPLDMTNTLRFMSDDEIELLRVLVCGVQWMHDEDIPDVAAAASRLRMKKGRPKIRGAGAGRLVDDLLKGGAA